MYQDSKSFTKLFMENGHIDFNKMMQKWDQFYQNLTLYPIT